MQQIIIIGGGIGGLCAAIALQKKGFQVKVYENAPELKPLGAGLGLAANAVRALIDIGIGDDILHAGKILAGLSIVDEKGKIITKTDSIAVSKKFGTDNFTIHRADLHEVLLKHLQPGTLFLGKSCTDIKQNSNGVEVAFEDGSKATAEGVIAADGIHSVIRQKLLPQHKPRYAGYTCWRAVIENKSLTLDTNFATETWGKNGRFGVVPLSGNRIYWFACKNAPYHNKRFSEFTVKDLLEEFKSYHAPIPQVLEMTDNRQLIWNDILDIKPIRQFAFNKIVLTGDAAHATTPNMGQGACQAIEDAIVLANCMAANPGRLEEAFLQFEKKRIGRTTKIVNTSWQLGKIAQLENPWLSKLRNAALRAVPASFSEKQLQFLYNVDFAH